MKKSRICFFKIARTQIYDFHSHGLNMTNLYYTIYIQTTRKFQLQRIATKMDPKVKEISFVNTAQENALFI
jgi:hypothetical protein